MAGTQTFKKQVFVCSHSGIQEVKLVPTLNGRMDVIEVKPFNLCIAFSYPAGLVCCDFASDAIHLPGVDPACFEHIMEGRRGVISNTWYLSILLSSLSIAIFERSTCFSV
jgi:hypothetical protein